MKRATPIARRTALQAMVMALAGCTPLAEIADEPSSTPLPTVPEAPNLTITPSSPIASPSKIVAVAAGGGSNLALRADGRVYGWGHTSILGLSNVRGQAINTPTLLPDVYEIDTVATAPYHCLFLRDGALIQRDFFRDMQTGMFDGIDQVTKVASSYASLLAVRTDGTVWAFGDNFYGQLGIGTLQNTDQFVQLPLTDIVDISLVDGIAVALREDGSVWEWGYPALTHTQGEYVTTPKLVAELEDVVDIAVAKGLAAVHSDQTASILYRDQLIRLPDLPPVIRTEGNDDTRYGMFLADDGILWGWGDGWYEFGLGATPEPTDYVEQFVARQVPVPHVVDFSCGTSNSLALDQDGTVWAWGHGYLGNNAPDHERQSIPIPIIYS